MKFKNKQNEEVKLEDGRVVWLSRAVAVVGVFCIKENSEYFFPLGKRSETMAEEVGKWCLPCGYIDFSESGSQAVVRESYEELGLDLRDEFTVDEQPFYVNTSPLENRQNISLSYGKVLDKKHMKPLYNPNCQEVDEAHWKSLKWIQENRDKIAFKHDERIEMFLKTLE